MAKVCILASLAILLLGLLVGAIVAGINYRDNNITLNELKSEKDSLLAPDIHDSEKLNTKKLEFERKALEIEEQELRTNKWYAAYIGCLIAFFVGFSFVLGCGILLESARHHPDIKNCVQACPVLRFFSSLFYPPSEEEVNNQINRALRVLPPDTAPLSVVHRRTRGREEREGNRETAADLPGVPSTSNDSEG